MKSYMLHPFNKNNWTLNNLSVALARSNLVLIVYEEISKSFIFLTKESQSDYKEKQFSKFIKNFVAVLIVLVFFKSKACDHTGVFSKVHFLHSLPQWKFSSQWYMDEYRLNNCFWVFLQKWHLYRIWIILC